MFCYCCVGALVGKNGFYRLYPEVKLKITESIKIRMIKIKLILLARSLGARPFLLCGGGSPLPHKRKKKGLVTRDYR